MKIHSLSIHVYYMKAEGGGEVRRTFKVQVRFEVLEWTEAATFKHKNPEEA